MRVFGGYYHWDGEFVGAEDVEGFKGRLEVRVIPAVYLDAQVFEDVEQQKGSEAEAAKEIAVDRDEGMLEALDKVKERIADMEQWLMDKPDNIKWKQEAWDKNEMPDVPLVDLPEELEDLVGDPAAGEALYASCAACHCADASGGCLPTATGVVGVSAETLDEFLRGDAPHPPSDLTDQEIVDLEAYLASLGG